MARAPLGDDITRAVLARDEVVAVPERQPRRDRPPGRTARARVPGRAAHAPAPRDLPGAQAPALPHLPQDRPAGRAHRPRAQGRRAPPHRLCVEPPQPHRLPARAVDARGCGRAAAGDCRGHQPVRRRARPHSQARHRRDPDPPQRQGSRLPDHPQGLHRRDPRPPRPDVLHRGRPKLQRRAQGAEDRPRARRAQRRTARAGVCAVRDFVRRDPRGRHPRAPEGEAPPAAVPSRAGRDGARGRRLPVARRRDLRRADCRLGHRPARAARRPGTGAPHPRHHRPVDEGDADDGHGGGDAAVDRTRRSRVGCRAAGGAARRGGRQHGVHRSAGRSSDQAARAFDVRGVVVEEDGRYRVRERTVLRYYARAIDHLLPTPSSRTH